MSGSFDAPETMGDFAVINGTAPVSTMYDYAKEVVQYTHAKAGLTALLKDMSHATMPMK